MTEQTVPSGSPVPSLAEVVAYISQAGWQLDDLPTASVWTPVDDSGANLQVALPKHDGVRDIETQLDEAIRVVAYVEGRTVAETANSMVNGGADTVSLRLLPDAPSGSAPLSLAQESITALRALIVGAAAALTNDDLVLPSRRPALVEQYAANAHISTRQGSFILDLALPLRVDADKMSRPPEQDTLMDVPAQPYGRRVTERIRQTAANALAMAQRVVEGEASIEQFARAHLRLGNAMELDALARLGGPEGTQYQLRLSQSALIRRTAPSTLFRATSAQRARLLEAAEFLRSTQPQTGITVEGFVVRLFREGAFGAGDVTVHAVLDDSGKTKSCVMSLAEEDYAEALRAHQDGLLVVAKGDLVTAGTRKRLQNPTQFHVIDPV